MDKIVLHNKVSTNLISSCDLRFARFPLRFTARKVTYTSSFISDYHYHDFPQVWYCEKGSYRHLVGEKSEIYYAGSFIIIPPGVSHGYEIFPDNETVLVCIEGEFSFFKTFAEPYKTHIISHLFLCRFFPSSMHNSLKTVMNFSGEEKESFDSLLLSLCSYDYYSSANNPAEIEALLTQLFAFPQFALPNEKISHYRSVIENKLSPLISVCAYLHKNYSQKIHGKELVRISTLCQSEFYKYFKLFTGTTYSIYLQMIRVRHALNLCSFSSYSFNYISDACGFGNVTYMEKLLKKYFKVPAGELRASGKKSSLYENHKILSHDYFLNVRDFYQK